MPPRRERPRLPIGSRTTTSLTGSVLPSLSQPIVQKQTIATDAGQFELHTYTVADSSSALIAAVCDYGTSVAGKDPDALLTGAEKGALDNFKAHPISSKKISRGDAQGVDFEAENDSKHISGRIYLHAGQAHSTSSW